MMRCVVTGLALCFLAAGSGCAVPRAVQPVPAERPGMPGAPPAADALPSFPLVKDDPAIAAATRRLVAADDAVRPSLLLARVKAAVAAGQRIRTEQGGPLTIGAWAPDYKKFLGFYDLAYRDLQELLVRFPKSPEAPEAGYLMGMIHDFHHLDNFEEALSWYRRTMESHPGTAWATRSGERIEFLGKFMNESGGSPHVR